MSKVNELSGINEEEFFLKAEFNGAITQKYKDRKQHNYETLIIENDTFQQTILFDFVMGGLYEFLEVGDTLSKKSGTLDLRLKRKDLDTLITMQIYDRRKKGQNGNE
jgi:hypothetical protein